jgi:histidine triad (HIT) family protein
MSTDCIFCKIVTGRIPCHKVHEDDRVLAFLDIMPLSAGHTLIIPKTHAERLDQMSQADAGACMAIAPKLAGAIAKATGATGYNLLQNNGRIAHQAVMHVHFHIIPKFQDAGLGIEWNPGKLSDEEAKKLTAAIRG